MTTDNGVIEVARQTLKIEADAVLALQQRIGEEFCRAVEMIVACDGRLVITGMGKSGLICQKVAATMASTGTPAFFFIPPKGSMATWAC